MKTLILALLASASLPAFSDTPLDGDILLNKIVFDGGVYDHTETVFMHIPPGDGLFFWDGTTGTPVTMPMEGFMTDLLSAPDIAAVKAAMAIPTAVSALTNDAGFITGSSLSGYLTTSGATAAYYPLSGNPSGFLTGVTSGNVTTALGFTPYNATNPNGYTSNTGTVTSVAAGTGLSGGTITSTGTISLPNTGTAGTYNGSITTDAQGRVSSAANIAISGGTGRSIVTTTSSTGFLVDASRDSTVTYDLDLSSTSTIGGPSTVTVFLETANTNSTTPGDWTTVAKVSNGQIVTLAIALQVVQTATIPLTRTIPAGKYVRLRSVTSGTASAAIAYSQEVKL